MRKPLLFALILALSMTALAQRTVSLDLNGTWKDSRNRDVQITHNGNSLSIRFASGAVFSGEIHGRQFVVRHSLSFEETNKSLPSPVREQITGEEVRIEGTVSDDSSQIQGTYYDKDPDWEHHSENDSYTIKGFKPGDRPISFYRGDLKISDVHLDYSPWLIQQTDLKRKQQSAKEDVQRAEEAVNARQQEAERARAACGPKEAQLDRLKQQVTEAQLAQRAGGPPEAQKTRAYKALEARINRLVLRQDQLYDRIVNAKQYSSNVPPEAMQRMLDEYDANKQEEASLRAQLKQMQDQMGYTAQVEAAKRRAIELDDAYFEAYKSYLKNELFEKELAEKRLLWAQDDLGKARDALSIIEQDVARLNPADSPNIVTINASADRGLRYDAEVWSPDVMEDLQREVRGLRDEVGRLNDIRWKARQDFLAAGDRSLAATDAVHSAIYKSAATQALIETGFNVWDLVEKSKNGGLYGALAEAVKKAAEALVLGAPSFAEPDVHAVWADFAIDSPKDAAKVLGKRAAKSGISGPLMKTTAEKTIATYMRDKTKSALEEAENAFFTSTKGTIYDYYAILRQREALQAAEERIAKAVAVRSTWSQIGKNIGENLKKSFWDPKEASLLKKSSFLTGLGKDVAKAQLKQWAANYFEGEALADSIAADVELSARAGLLMSASSTYWHARDVWEFKRDLLDELSEQYDPKNNLKVKTNTTFRTGTTLSVTFTTLDGHTDNHEFEVTVGGKRAQRSSGLTYTVSTTDMQKDANGGVILNVRILR